MRLGPVRSQLDGSALLDRAGVDLVCEVERRVDSEVLRHQALECLDMAKATTDLRARRTLLCMVEVWTKLLDQRFTTDEVDGLVDMLDTATVPRESSALAA